MELVYEILSKYMEERDKLFLVYIVVALVLQKEKVNSDEYWSLKNFRKSYIIMKEKKKPNCWSI